MSDVRWGGKAFARRQRPVGLGRERRADPPGGESVELVRELEHMRVIASQERDRSSREGPDDVAIFDPPSRSRLPAISAARNISRAWFVFPGPPWFKEV